MELKQILADKNEDLIFENIKNTRKIEELDYENNSEYEERRVEEVLHPLIKENQVIIVAGAYFGDEGKGKTVDAIAHNEDIKLILRVNSGENAGHTVFNNNEKFVFNLAPSGLLMKEKTNLIGPECVMDLVSFMQKELSQLTEKNISYKDRLFIGNVHIVTPYHKLIDFIGNLNNSSTLKGMSPVHASKVSKRGIRLDHLFNSKEIVKKRLEKDMITYYGLLKVKNLSEEQIIEMCEEINSDGEIRIPLYVIDFLKALDKTEYLINLYDKFVVNNKDFPQMVDTTYLTQKILKEGGKILVEGPQSYWLSNGSEKFWESSTSANTSASGILAATKFNFQKYKSVVINIHKTPASSRVGIGANPSSYVSQDFFSRKNINTLKDLGDACTNFDTIQKQFFDSIQENGILKPTTYEDETGSYKINVAMAIGSSIQHGECGATTKKPRVCGLFDCVAHYEVNETQGPYLSISAVDRGDDYDEIGVTIAYIYYSPENKSTFSNGKEYKNGTIIKAGNSLPTEQVLYNCYPIIKTIKGWKETPIAKNKRKGNELPKGVQDLIGTIEHFTGAKIISIGNGPNTDELIYIKNKQN
ncbi:MAG: adenylosuccinate synthetase [Candidatus Woesearchaeota archaeon]|jgi:adenylosuccinate synthase|nr:adenylosuccinate synthetase [Candidatus Woesearchaeota archaeon]